MAAESHRRLTENPRTELLCVHLPSGKRAQGTEELDQADGAHHLAQRPYSSRHTKREPYNQLNYKGG